MSANGSNGVRGPLLLDDPLDIDDARHAAHLLAEKRRDTEGSLEQAVIEASDAEAAYRKALAKQMIKQRGDGEPATGLEQLAKGADHIADLSRDRDLKRGMVGVIRERLTGLEGERAMLRGLMSWSERINLDELQREAQQAEAPF